MIDFKNARFEFANQARIKELSTEARDFFSKVFDMNYDEMFVSDESTIIDFLPFGGEDEVKEVASKLEAWLGYLPPGNTRVVELLEEARQRNVRH